MSGGKLFSFENFSLSVLAHAVLIFAAVAIALVATPQKIIAPDRIKIMEIDLENVKIEGLETKLRNQEEKGQGKTDREQEKKSDAKKNGKPAEIKTIKVNREVHNLDRTMTISVIDALRIAMTRCWQIDSARSDLIEIRAVAHLKLFPNGKVQSYWFEQQSRADNDPSFAYVLETIRLAVDACNPFSMLPRGEYEKWKSVQLTFFPTAKVVE
ncbi:MAG: hypothetical protein LBT45_03315 [Rickettsiales bacterium]|jgi:hypothetical protein|nr:hypothetical protein [Rickettsiales bacterium]